MDFLLALLLNGLDKGANISQFVSLYNNLMQTSNDEIMRRLEKQDDIYFEKIIKQNERIIELLECMKNNNNI